jgi:hypothetical protein
MAAATGLCLFVHGCIDVDGGAVELSWKLRPRSSEVEDKFVDCNSRLAGTNAITRMRLNWQVGDVLGSEEWPCNDSHGVTGFELPAGTALLSVVPICASGPALTDSYIAPSVEQRRVTTGDTVSLGAVELIVTVDYCDAAPCICE